MSMTDAERAELEYLRAQLAAADELVEAVSGYLHPSLIPDACHRYRTARLTRRERWERVTPEELGPELDLRLNLGQSRDTFDPRYADTEETWRITFGGEE